MDAPITGAAQQAVTYRNVILGSHPPDPDRDDLVNHVDSAAKTKKAARTTLAAGLIKFVQVKQRGSAPHLPIRNNRPHPGYHWKRRFHLPFRWTYYTVTYRDIATTIYR